MPPIELCSGCARWQASRSCQIAPTASDCSDDSIFANQSVHSLSTFSTDSSNNPPPSPIDDIPPLVVVKSKVKKKKVKVIDIAPAAPSKPKIKSPNPAMDVQPVENHQRVECSTPIPPPLSPVNTPTQPSDTSVNNINVQSELPASTASPIIMSSIASPQKSLSSDSLLSNNETDTTSELSVDSSMFSIRMPSDVSSLVNKLVNTTAATRNGIRDPGVLYNSKAIKDLLLRWANQSAKIEKEFRKECFKNLPQAIQDNVTPSFLSGFEIECRKLFFAQLASAFGEVSNVAMLCFETMIHPKQCETIRHHEVALLNLETSFAEIHNNIVEEWKVLSEMNTNEENGALQAELSQTMDEDGALLEADPHEPMRDSNADVLTSSAQFVIIPSVAGDNTSHMDENRNFGQGIVDVQELRCSSRIDDGRESRSSSLFDDGRESRSDSHLDQISVVSTALSKSDCTDLDMILDASESDIGLLNENHLLCENFTIEETEECSSCFLDKCRACFVLRYFPVLDFIRMRSLLLWNGGCRWRTWLACMTHLNDLYKNTSTSELIVNNCIPNTFTGSEHDIRYLLGLLPRLYHLSPDIVLEYVHYEGLLDPWEVTLLYHTEYLPNSCVNDFLHYALTQFTTQHLDSLFAVNTLHSALMFQPNKTDLFCTCGKPRPGSHKLEWQRQNLLMKLVEHVVEGSHMAVDRNLVAKFSHLFAKNGFWLGHLHMLLFHGEDGDLLALIHQLGDYALLEDFLARRKVVPTDDLWEGQFEKLYEDMEDNVDHVCTPLPHFERTLTIKKLVEIAATHSGAKFTLSMMKKFRNTNMFPSHVYLALAKAAELENKQDALVSKLIEVASAKIWSDTRTSLHPHFQVVRNADIAGTEVATSLSPTAFERSPYVMDECDTTWGRSINISTKECPVCTLPLCLKTMAASLIVFQCGHSFHKLCLPETACLVCFHDNFKSLY